MRIAVEGCMHGDLDNVYRTLQYMEQAQNIKIDLLLCCGDFQVLLHSCLHPIFPSIFPILKYLPPDLGC